ncbi:uncharacterized protein, partial [Parasteatoda tepidariorum]|uniref:uncharacterized protein n=1 Tax=Parasteatoda tepidariorum TaxID=114398 RepID=UPI0039BD32E0
LIVETADTVCCVGDSLQVFQECSAYNYLETNESCQLIATANLSDSEPDPNSKVVLKKLTCNINPCLQGGTCHEVPTSVYDVRGYKCSCPCGRCGHNCNRLHFGQVEDACIYLFNAGYKKVESQEECMSFCWDTQGCRSADYISSEGACWLNSVTGDEEPLTMDCDKWYPGVAYLFFNCTCDPSD